MIWMPTIKLYTFSLPLLTWIISCLEWSAITSGKAESDPWCEKEIYVALWYVRVHIISEIQSHQGGIVGVAWQTKSGKSISVKWIKWQQEIWTTESSPMLHLPSATCSKIKTKMYQPSNTALNYSLYRYSRYMSVFLMEEDGYRIGQI